MSDARAGGGPAPVEPEDEVERTLDAYEQAFRSLAEVMTAVLSSEASLEAEESRRAVEGATKAELRALRSSRMALIEIRKQLTPPLERARSRLRAFEREWFEPDA